MTPRTVSTAAAVLACFLLSGCVTHPAPLQGEYLPVTPQQAGSGNHTGAPVRWGGRVIEVQPQADRTCFTMLSAQLDPYGRPSHSPDGSDGRFMACRTGFYDPAVFTAEREVTFTGRITGYEDTRIGEYNYRLPHMDADVVYLWPERSDTQTIIHHPHPHPAFWHPYGWWW
ncbi:Slp family lipoprotein [Luteimonas sp. MJ293]|uniref:Slp family lipoprotein n=1 Tax=Luteimonas sp. MJ146 TaxID=3129240 RepID=UPI0031BBC254